MIPLVLLVGFKGSGKSTAAAGLEKVGYMPLSFADAIKDTLSAMFCWPRDMLAGITPESRKWREEVDTWWSNKLGIPNFTPRMAMETIGTQVMRHNFNNNIWLFNVERRISSLTKDQKIVLVDGRHAHEIKMAQDANGISIRIKRGPDPSWYDIALAANNGDTFSKMKMIELGIHDSEWGWIGSKIDYLVENDGSEDDLHENILRVVLNARR